MLEKTQQEGGRDFVFLVPACFSPPVLWHSACTWARSDAYLPLSFSSIPQVALAARPSGTPTGSFLVNFVGTPEGSPACQSKPAALLPSRGLMLHPLQSGLDFSRWWGEDCPASYRTRSFVPGLSLLGVGSVPYLPRSWLSTVSPTITKRPLRGQNHPCWEPQMQ